MVAFDPARLDSTVQRNGREERRGEERRREDKTGLLVGEFGPCSGGWRLGGIDRDPGGSCGEPRGIKVKISLTRSEAKQDDLRWKERRSPLVERRSQKRDYAKSRSLL